MLYIRIGTIYIECMIHANVRVMMGSIRAGRRCPEIASWVLDVATDASELTYELVDLADWPLPMDDEPGIPALGLYQHSHTQAWSRKIADADGVIFVTPQYNWGGPIDPVRDFSAAADLIRQAIGELSAVLAEKAAPLHAR